MEYDDFIVGIGPCLGDGYAIQVRSPAGEGRGVFRLPFNLDELSFFTSGRWLARQAVQRRGQKPPTRHLTPRYQPLAGLSAEDFGGQLFRALFSGEVKSLFHESLGQIEKPPARGLRIRIEIDPRDPLLARLYGLPWELLYRQETDDFVGLTRTTPLVRCLPVHRAPRPLRCSQIRVLVVPSSPTSLPPLELARERQGLESSWGRPQGVHFEVLKKADPESLRRALLQGEFHVLHFMGHGEFSEADGEGVLFFEAEDRSPRPVSGRALAVQLKDVKSLRLVVLNACETGKAVSASGLNPFAGVATALALGGVPAVVAMQAPIPDPAALAFSRSFYERLAAGEPVDAAVTEARLSIHGLNDKAVDWATPLLLLRSRDGKLFAERSAPLQVKRRIAAGVGVLLLGALAWMVLSGIEEPQGQQTAHRGTSASSPPARKLSVFETSSPRTEQHEPETVDSSLAEAFPPLGPGSESGDQTSDFIDPAADPFLTEAADGELSSDSPEETAATMGGDAFLPSTTDLSGSTAQPDSLSALTGPVSTRDVKEFLYIGDDWPTLVLETLECAPGKVLAHFSVRNHFEEEVVVSLVEPEEAAYMLDSRGYAYDFVQASGIDAAGGVSLRPGEKATFTVLFKGRENSPLQTLSLRISLKARGSSLYGKRDFAVKTITLG